MREVDRDRRAPVIGHDVAEHPREVRNRQPRARMPHRRADDDLRVDEDGRGGGDPPHRRARVPGLSTVEGPGPSAVEGRVADPRRFGGVA